METQLVMLKALKNIYSNDVSVYYLQHLGARMTVHFADWINSNGQFHVTQH